MNIYTKTLTLDYPVTVSPMGKIAGYPVRPGLFDINGAMALPVGVNFTIHTHGGTRCELLLFSPGKRSRMLSFPSRRNIKSAMSIP